MKDKLKSMLIWDVHNSRFRSMFIKNWLLVFLCIVVPLFIGVLSMQRYSDKSILREVDASVQRSADNTTSTVTTLLNEACMILKREISNDNVNLFLKSKGSSPQTYGDVVIVRAVLDLVSKDYRESLYFSVDVYSGMSDRIISSYYKGQHYAILNDETLRNTYFEYADRMSGHAMFAAPRELRDAEGNALQVITIYLPTIDPKDNGFVSISIDTDKLISHITRNNQRVDGTYLLVDEDGRVVMNTSDHLNGLELEYLVDERQQFPLTKNVDGQIMRIGVEDLGLFGWKCVQMVPVKELEANSLRLRNLLIEIVLFGMFAACFISYYVTCKLFRPIRSILHILESPSEEVMDVAERDEYRYLLVQILELFQKNITLESKMAERVIALRSARAKALQGQLTPHFLNNVLQTINWIVIEETGKEHSRTSEAIMLLADVIRLGKEKSNNFTSVEEEIAYTRRYVELEQLRYGDGIRCHFLIDNTIKDRLIPCVSIQPLVENAILHGLQPKEGEGDIYISVSQSISNGLHIIVEDSGVGMRQDVIDRIFEFMNEEYIYLGEHLGVVNLFQRFRLIYGSDCRFEITKSIYGGTYVSIETPEFSGLVKPSVEK